MDTRSERKLKVLVTEDEEMILQIVEFALRRHGFQVLVARDGSEALSVVRAEKPDLVVMDMMMPVMSGYDATRALRKDKSTCGIPILGFTARAMDKERSLAYEVGCDDVVIKPFEIDDLLERILALIGKRGLKGQLSV